MGAGGPLSPPATTAPGAAAAPAAAATPGHTHCPYCALQCGMHVRPGAERPVEGEPSSPASRGRLCMKGFTAADLLDHPRRLRQPLVRARGELRPASWEAALDELAARLDAVRRHHGPPAVGVFGSGALTNEKAYALGKWARLVLATPSIDYNGRYCMASGAAGQNLAFGVDRGLPFPLTDIARTGTLVLWGSNGAETMPPIWQWVDELRHAGGTVVVVDPRRTESAAAAHLHVQPLPGTDLAVLMGALHVAVVDHLVDDAYVAARTTGWDEARRAVIAWTPERVERTSGVPAATVRRLAHLLADRRGAMLLSGRGAEQQAKGTDTVCAMTNLMLALGQVGRPASGYGCVTGQGNGQGGREHGQKADQLPGYRSITDDADRAAVARAWGVDPAVLPGAGASAVEMLAGLGTEVRALVVVGSNVAVASPGTDDVVAGLRRLDCLAVLDSLPNETTELADVVLPVTQWAEEDGTTTNLEGRVLRRRRLVDPPASVRSDLWVLRELAVRLGGARHMASDDPADVWAELAAATAGSRADYSGITWDRLDAEGGIQWPCPRADHPGTPRLFADRFAHPDGRARFLPSRWRPPAEVVDDDHPIWFTTGRLKEHYNSGAQTRLVGRLAASRPGPLLQLHPLLADRLGLATGDDVVVESRRGSAAFRAEIDPAIRPDTVFAPVHWGGRGAANQVTNPALDPTSRMPELKVCAVRVRAAGPS